ncbi:hypothetical protein JCM11491_002823 [Sporobolomyces phaffii]
MSLARRGGRIPALQRAEQAQLQEALEASQAAAAMASSAEGCDQHDAPPRSAAALPTATAPFETLRGTLDNTVTTTTDDSGSTPLRVSSSSDQILPCSLNPLVAVRSTPTAAAHSSISDPDTSGARPKSGATTGQTDEIRTTTTSDSNPLADPMVTGSDVAIGEGDVVPDSDNEGSGPASFELGASGGGGGDGGGESIRMGLPAPAGGNNPIIPGIGRLPTLPTRTGPSPSDAGSAVVKAAATTSVSSSSSSKRQRAYVEVPQPGDRVGSVPKLSKGKGSTLSKATIDSDDLDDDGSTLSVRGAREKMRGDKHQGAKRRIPIGSSDDDDDDDREVAHEAMTKKPRKTSKKGPVVAQDVDESSPLTDYDEPNLKKKSKPGKSRTSSVTKQQRAAPSSPDPLAAPLDLDLEASAAGSSARSKPPTSSGPPRLTSIDESSGASGGVSLVRRRSDEFAHAAAEIERKQEEDDDEFGVKKAARKKSVTTKRKKSTGVTTAAAAAVVVRTKSKSMIDETSAIAVKKRRVGSKGKSVEDDEAGGSGIAADSTETGPKDGRDEAAVESTTESKANEKGKGKGNEKDRARGKKSKIVVSSDDDDEKEGALDLDEEDEDAQGSRRSPRVNKGKAKKRLGEDDDVAHEDAHPPHEKVKRQAPKGKGKQKAIETSEAEVEGEGDDGLDVDGAVPASGEKHAVEEPDPSASTTASTSTSKQGTAKAATSTSPANSRGSRSASVAKSVSPAVSRGRSMSKEERAADASKRMGLVMEAAAIPDPKAFDFVAQDDKNKKKVVTKQKRKAVETDSDADDESDGPSEAEESDDGVENKTKPKATSAGRDVAVKGQVAKENEDLPTPKPKSVTALARGRDRSGSPFSKTPKPGSLADIIAKKNIGSYLSPGLSSRSKVPSLHRNLKPPTVQKVITVKRPVKKKKKGEYSCSDEEKPWYEQKDPEEWDSDDQARWNRRQKRIDRGLPADTDNDSD